MKNKHLTLSDRNDIQIGIEQLKPFSAIAAKLGKDPSTISKEVRRNRVIKENSSTTNCEACPLLKKAPYVCNACPKKYLEKGYLSTKPIDFPRVVKFRKRRTRNLQPIPKTAKEGRSYEDFQRFLTEKGSSYWLEMDTVTGRIGGKVLLTFNLSFCNFIFARLLDNKTANEVAKHLYAIKNDLHQKEMDFCELFPVILTDNGGEFARVDDIEMDIRGESKLFFCDPNRSDQKGRIEKNHTLIRDILPKGSSFDNLTQEDINLVCSHVNSVRRASFNLV
ncbi:IS30 family transposase [Streptococcus suis]|uniref:IS30 family transposase n=1 Tax=Streptococcus suis TaxID=1307 RepID=A0A7T1P4M2_STRSU|nr:IS30 family transposase [Streptococcus suis]